MNNTVLENNSTEQYFIVNNSYGKTTETPFNIHQIIDENYKGTNSQKVVLDNQLEAFIEMGSPNYAFDYKLVSCELANLFDIKTVPINRIKTSTNRTGIIRNSNEGPDEVAINFNKIAKSLYKRIQDGEIKGADWLDAISKLSYSAPGKPIDNEEEIKRILDMAIFIVSQSFSNISQLKFIKFKQAYLAMLVFDYLTNQAKRTLEGYSVVVNKNSGDPSFGALYSYNCQDNTDLNSNEYLLNSSVVNRDALINCIYKYYYNDIEEFSRMLFDYQADYKKSIELIVKNNIQNGDYNNLLKLINQNFDKLIDLEKSYRNEEKNKIDLTKTNIGNELKAKHNNNEIIAKYPEPTVYQQVDQEDSPAFEEGLKLTLEPIRARSGFVNGTLIFLLIAFICGVGVGIGYVIFNLSGM